MLRKIISRLLHGDPARSGMQPFRFWQWVAIFAALVAIFGWQG